MATIVLDIYGQGVAVQSCQNKEATGAELRRPQLADLWMTGIYVD